MRTQGQRDYTEIQEYINIAQVMLLEDQIVTNTVRCETPKN